MNNKRLFAAGLACLSALLPASCAKPLDLCADQAGACLTVQVTTDSEGPVDLLRALVEYQKRDRRFGGLTRSNKVEEWLAEALGVPAR